MITAILQYCTLDYKFLEVNLKNLSRFSNEIIIPICDHLFNGEKESEEGIKKTLEITKRFSNAKPYLFTWKGFVSNQKYYHNLSRKIGTEYSSNDWLLFLDGDEVVDDNFKYWFEQIKHTDATYWLTCHWYFREPIYRATKTECAGLVIRKQHCMWNLQTELERQQFHYLPNIINGDHQVIGYNKKPVIHHFSWVRTKTEMLQKVRNWGHRNDRDWEKSIEEEFSRPFNGTDFVHGYKYDIVDNEFNIIM